MAKTYTKFQKDQYKIVRGRIRPNFELMQAPMYVIVTCKYKKDPIKNS